MGRFVGDAEQQHLQLRPSLRSLLAELGTRAGAFAESFPVPATGILKQSARGMELALTRRIVADKRLRGLLNAEFLVQDEIG